MPRVSRSKWRWLPLVLESFGQLVICKCEIIFLKQSRWVRRCGHFQYETLREPLPPADLSRVLAVRQALVWTARRVPFRSVCLDQALAAQRMLTARSVSSTLYLGLLKNEQGAWTAHAWLRAGRQWVVGYQPNRHYTVVGAYSWLGEGG